MCIYLRLYLNALIGNYKITFLRKERFEMLYETIRGGEVRRAIISIESMGGRGAWLSD